MLTSLYQQALTWGVNPLIFVCIYLFSFVPFYFGIFLILKGSHLTKITFKEIRNFRFGRISLFNGTTFLGLLINRLAWTSPYLYIEIVGKNLPASIHLLIWSWLIMGICFFIYKLACRQRRIIHHDNL